MVNAGKVAVAIAVVGVAIGLVPLLFGFVGDTHALYGSEEAIDRYDNRFEDVPSEQRDQAEQREAAQQQQSLVRFVVGGAGATFSSSYWPGYLQLLAIVVSGLVGALVAVRVSGETSEVLLTAGGGALVGAFLFVFLSAFLAIQGWETVPEAARQSETVSEASLRYGALLINSIVIGVLGAVASVGSAFFTHQLGE
ncbi:hypothetical protein [Halapricum salinum]|uniref:hypothetical protein n=1 Tax=Halapricum salinum TaxID=1457250 RepID=UPI0012ABCC2E|nr:hypothetical protein [Halapricum salinum]